jgi:hypothetical protein
VGLERGATEELLESYECYHILDYSKRITDKIISFIAGFEVLIGAVMSVAIFWTIESCSPYDGSEKRITSIFRVENKRARNQHVADV